MEMATLEFRYAVMNAGKTNHLLALAQSLIGCGEKPLLISSALDCRFGEGVIASRSGWSMPCTTVTNKTNIFDVVKDLVESTDKKIKQIIIDEIQFFTVGQVEQIARVVDELNITVTAFGLNVDSNGNLFNASRRMFELADDYSRIGVKHCHCGSKATMILRFNGTTRKVIKNAEAIMVGAEDCYDSVCRKCWKENKLSPVCNEE